MNLIEGTFAASDVGVRKLKVNFRDHVLLDLLFQLFDRVQDLSAHVPSQTPPRGIQQMFLVVLELDRVIVGT